MVRPLIRLSLVALAVLILGAAAGVRARRGR